MKKLLSHPQSRALKQIFSTPMSQPSISVTATQLLLWGSSVVSCSLGAGVECLATNSPTCGPVDFQGWSTAWFPQNERDKTIRVPISALPWIFISVRRRHRNSQRQGPPKCDQCSSPMHWSHIFRCRKSRLCSQAWSFDIHEPTVCLSWTPVGPYTTKQFGAEWPCGLHLKPQSTQEPPGTSVTSRHTPVLSISSSSYEAY